MPYEGFSFLTRGEDGIWRRRTTNRSPSRGDATEYSVSTYPNGLVPSSNHELSRVFPPRVGPNGLGPLSSSLSWLHDCWGSQHSSLLSARMCSKNSCWELSTARKGVGFKPDSQPHAGPISQHGGPRQPVPPSGPRPPSRDKMGSSSRPLGIYQLHRSSRQSSGLSALASQHHPSSCTSLAPLLPPTQASTLSPFLIGCFILPLMLAQFLRTSHACSPRDGSLCSRLRAARFRPEPRGVRHQNALFYPGRDRRAN